MFQWYNSCLNKYPYVTNAITGFTLAVVGDITCQFYEHKYLSHKSNKNIDNKNSTIYSNRFDMFVNYNRSLEMGAIRAVVIVPFIMFWYPFLTKINPGKSLSNVVGRVIIDQLIGSPIVISLVFMSNGCIHGNIFESIDKIKTQGLIVWYTGLRYWPVVHCFNFGLVPLQHQALFAHFASIYWNAILSYYTYKQVVDLPL